ncbi:MAG: helix-hairpin-helix domain-containing protein [Chloroflexota bacterium]
MEKFGSLDDALFAEDIRVDLNTANQTQLAAVPGVGHRLAKTIIAHRPYDSVNDLRQVPGIGPKRFEAIKDWYCVILPETDSETSEDSYGV